MSTSKTQPPILVGTTAPIVMDVVLRVSKKGSREMLHSPQWQLAEVKRGMPLLAQQLGRPVVLGKTFREIDESGKTTDRAALRAVRERLERNEAQGFIVAYVSRFSRNTVEGLQLVQWTLARGSHFKAMDCPFDLRTPEGEEYLTTLLARAQREWRQAKAIFDKGVSEAIGRGVNINVPFGYQRAAGRGTKLVKHPAEAPMVKELYQRRAAGESWGAIARDWNEAGKLPRPYPRHSEGEHGEDVVTIIQGKWRPKALRGMVENEVYLGVARAAGLRTEKAHPALIDRETWLKANAAKGVKFARADEGTRLGGLLRCSGCGYAMTYQGTAGGSSQAYYRCRTAQNAAGSCPAPASVRADEAEAWVREQYLEAVAGWWAEPGKDDDELQAALLAEADTLKAAEAAADALAAPDLSSFQRARLKALADETEAAYEQAARKAAAERERAAAGLTMPARVMTAEEYDSHGVEAQRHLLSGVFGAVVARRAEVWREAVAERLTPISRAAVADLKRHALLALARAA